MERFIVYAVKDQQGLSEMSVSVWQHMFCCKN